jgi:hypothetical protein
MILTSTSPTCSQCQISPLLCRYSEGGRRGLPVAYMTSLEARLQDTEAALFAALSTLQEIDSVHSVSLKTDGSSMQCSKPQRSKVEKQKDWKRRPLQTREDIITWFHDEQQQRGRARDLTRDAAPTSAVPSETRSCTTTQPMPSLYEDQPAVRSQSASGAGVERLRSCRPPRAPNVSSPAGHSAAWLNNYF